MMPIKKKYTASDSFLYRELLARLFVVLCFAPYLIMGGYILYSVTIGEKGSLEILRIMAIATWITVFNSVAGIPLMVIKYDKKLKSNVVMGYLFGVILPAALILISALFKY
jgi:hypothetical protein